MGVTVTGLSEVLQALEGMSAAAADLTIALQAGSEVILDGSYERWPVQDHTGKLRRSGMIRVGKNSAKVIFAAKYARYLQYGKRVHHRYQILDPTAAEITQVREILADHVMAGLDAGDVAAIRRVTKRRRSG